jgi:TolA-binding protein
MTNFPNKCVKGFIYILLASTHLAYAESSVYGFGTDETESEAQMSSVSSANTIPALKQQIAQQQERIDGLTTIIEGLSATINELQQAKNMNNASMEQSDTSNTALLKKLATMIDEINANYVTKQELQNALGGKKSVASSTPTVTQSKDSIEGQSPSELYSEGVRLFGKKRYEEAHKRFEITDVKGYKPAASNYYLGEIAYYTNKYDDAIFYFKKSAGLYDKASYIDTLLLHTAVSLEKIGDKGQAKAFYENIIENYPQKKTAQIAKERLKKL